MAGQTGEHSRFLLGRAESDLKTNKPAIKELKLKSKRKKYTFCFVNLYLMCLKRRQEHQSILKHRANLDAVLLLNLFDAEFN